MGNSASDDQKFSKSLSGEYLIEQAPYLFHKRSNQPCILHKIITNTHSEADYTAQVIDQYAKTRCQSISQLKNHYRIDKSGYCSDEQIFYLIFQGRNNLTLKQEIDQRKTQQAILKEQEIMHILQTYLSGLREYSQRFRRQFQWIGLDNISIDQRTRKMTVKDPWLLSNNSNTQIDHLTQILKGYPSPEKLSIANNSKSSNYDEFTSNLFSVGVIGLQLHNLQSLENLYLKKKQVNLEQLRSRVSKFKDQKLRRGLDCLLNTTPSQRNKIYQIWTVQHTEEHFLPPISTPQSTDRQLKPLEKIQTNFIPSSSNRSLMSPRQQNQQQYMIERMHSPLPRKNSPPITFTSNRFEDPPKRGNSTGVPSPIKISYNEQNQRVSLPPKENNNSANNNTNAFSTDSPYNQTYYYQNKDNSSINPLSKNNNTQIPIQNFPKDKYTKQDNSAAKSTDKKLNPLTQQKQKSALLSPRLVSQKNSQTPKRPTKKFNHNSTIVQARQEQSPQRSLKSQDPADIEYVTQSYGPTSRYEGYKSNGMRNGIGKFYYQDGGYYEGHWKNNKMDGYGRLYYFGGKLAYEGNWSEDQFNGQGKVYNDNPAKLTAPFDYTNFDLLQDYWQSYEGNLSKDTKEGRGRITLSNGEYFEGDFHNDRIQGLGKFYNYEGKVIEGIWKQSKLLKVMNSS